MTNELVFYDLVYSADDGGWYGQAFRKDGKDWFETSILPTQEMAKRAVLAKAPEAKLLRVIN